MYKLPVILFLLLTSCHTTTFESWEWETCEEACKTRGGCSKVSYNPIRSSASWLQCKDGFSAWIERPK